MPYKDPAQAKKYAKAYHQAHKESRIRKTKEWQAAHEDRDKIRRRKVHKETYPERHALIDAIKLEAGCADCGYNEYACGLDFHHRDPATKTAPVSNLLKASIPRLMTEIAKCEVICAICHRVRNMKAREQS
jgi:hypothetical protein